jgi:drug/metabolite transporter (DMT)-like permease
MRPGSGPRFQPKEARDFFGARTFARNGLAAMPAGTGNRRFKGLGVSQIHARGGLMTRRSATAIGFVAVLLWSLLALLTVGTAPMPPLLLNAVCFSIGGTIGLVWIARSGGFAVLARVPLRVYVFGTAGLFGYHFLYFTALRMAPAAEAGLIAYLWPLLIVLMSGLLPGERLLPGHIAGALTGFVGAALIVSAGASGFDPAALPGYALAFLCALTWSGYSVASRRLGNVPTASVAVFCIATAVLSALAHLALEETVWPATTLGWVSMVVLGLGPVGLAFFVWDIGVKRGDIQLLGTASYAAPLLSTLALILAGVATASWTLLVAACLIAGGAALAATASTRVSPSV